MGQRVGYVRVSTIEQNLDRQLEGETLDKVFSDKASAKDNNRPKLKEMLEYVREGDTIVVHSMDRLARNVDDLCRLVQSQTARGVCVHFIKENLPFTGAKDSLANLMLSVLGVVAGFERNLIRERQREGIAIAKISGVYKGRKPAFDRVKLPELREQVARGENSAEISRHFNITRETLYKYLA